MEYLEPYVKENNLLQLSLFYFGKGRPRQTLVQWSDKEGQYALKCSCSYGVPGSFEQDVYTACMRIWVKQGMPGAKICLNYSDIARELGIKPRDWNGRIKKALTCLAQARYEYIQCFVKADKDGNQKISTHFSLFDSVSLFQHEPHKSKRNSESELIFPDIIKENLEAKYYQFLEMAWYRSLPEGLPRRLYEYLEKRRYHIINGRFTIAEKNLCRWLPIFDKHVTKRRKRLASISQALIDKGYLSSYHFDRQKKQCVFSYAQPHLPSQVHPSPSSAQLASGPAQVPSANSSSVATNGPASFTTEELRTYQECIDWLYSKKAIPYLHESRKQEIARIDIATLAKYYPLIRKNYEQGRQRGTIQSPAGWIVDQFRHMHKYYGPVVAQNELQQQRRQALQTQRELDKAKQIAAQRAGAQEAQKLDKLLALMAPQERQLREARARARLMRAGAPAELIRYCAIKAEMARQLKEEGLL